MAFPFDGSFPYFNTLIHTLLVPLISLSGATLFYPLGYGNTECLLFLRWFLGAIRFGIIVWDLLQILYYEIIPKAYELFLILPLLLPLLNTGGGSMGARAGCCAR